MKKITAILGDYYHDEELIRESLLQAIGTWAGGVSDVSLRLVGPGRLQEALAAKPDAVVLFKEDRLTPVQDEHARWMTEAISRSIANYVEAGGGWLAWHSGLASYDPQGTYVSMLRGHFLQHPSEHQSVTYTMQGTGFGSAAVPESFTLLDEQYFVTCEEDRTDVFLRSESVDGASVAGWRHPVGRGRVCCLTPAHRKEGLLNGDFMALLGQSVKWCCGE